MQNRKSEAEVAASELHKACIHEAGHAVVAKALGGEGDAEVWQNDSDYVLRGEKAWRGTFHLRILPDAFDAFPEALKQMQRPPAPSNWRPIVGVAGVVAECIDQGETEAWIVHQTVSELVDIDEMSATDRELMGIDCLEEDVAEARAILVKHWDDVLDRANSLKESALRNAGMERG